MPNQGLWIGLGIVAVLGVLYLLFRSIVRFIPDYKRLGVYRGGVFVGDKGPGVYLTLPLLDRVRYVDVRFQKMKIERYRFITKDGLNVHMTTISFYVIEDTYFYLNRIFDFKDSFKDLILSSVAMTVADYNQQDLLASIQTIRQEALDHIKLISESWGVKLETLEFMDIALGE